MKNIEEKESQNTAFLKYNCIAVLLFSFLLIIAHLLTPNGFDGYNDPIKNLTSKNYEYGWIVKIGYVVFGFLIYYGSFAKVVAAKAKIGSIHELFMVLYGISYVTLGFFMFDPIFENINFVGREFSIYFLIVTASHIFLFFSLFSSIILDVELRKIHFLFFVLSFILFVWHQHSNQNIGVIERFLFLVQLIWLAVFYNKPKKA